MIFNLPKHLFKFFALVGLIFVSQLSFAQCSTSSDPVVISGTNCEELSITSNKNAFTVTSAGYIGTIFGITSYTPALSINNGGNINLLTNNGYIQGQSQNRDAIALSSGGQIGTLNNASTITASQNGIGLYNNAAIGVINNSGAINNTGVQSINGSRAIYLQATSTGTPSIGTINNSGSIGGSNGGIYLDTAPTNSSGAYIGAISNSGGIDGGYGSGIVVGTGNTVNSINNNTGGVINSTYCPGGSCKDGIENWGTISEINNAGTIRGGNAYGGVGNGIFNTGLIGTISNSNTIAGGIYNTGTILLINNAANTSGSGIVGNGNPGIYNSGSISILNNAQSDLIYRGQLPDSYGIIVNSPTSYGQMSVTSPTGVMKFDAIAANVSSVPVGTTQFTNVLSGVADGNINSISRSGTFYGAFVNQSWNLNQVGNSQIWNLDVSQTNIASPNVSGSSAGTKLAKAIATTTGKVVPTTVAPPPVTTTTTTPTVNPPVVPTTTTTQVTTSVITPTVTSQPTVTKTVTVTSITTPSGTTISTPVTNTTNTPTTVPAPVTTTKTDVTQTFVYTPASTSQATTTTTTTSTSTTQVPTGPVLKNGTSLVSAVQAMTTSQANQFSAVHAEGYSSNMTIGLQQMAAVTNTVMDRIHTSMTSSPTAKVYQDDEGKYVWGDISGGHGTVNNYNDLAGFGYDLYNMLLGADLQRNQNGGYGVFAGVGGSNMTSSQQVSQNFNTTSYYAGLYATRNFEEQVKLSGALGYAYGSTNANRNTPNVGSFTGGNATSSYKSNGAYAAAKLAKAYQADSYTLSPFIGASYSQLWTGGVSEQGGNDFNFGINSASAYSAISFAGVDFVYPLLKGINDPLSLIGFYKFGYDWFANSNSAHSITATSPIYGSFTQVGANMGPVSNMIGLGLQGGITKEISARIGVVASSNSYGNSYGGGAELRFKF